METKTFIIFALLVLSTVLVLRVASTKQNIEGPVGSNKSLGSNKPKKLGEQVTLRRKKNSRNLGASLGARPKPLGFNFADAIASFVPSTSSTNIGDIGEVTYLTAGGLPSIPGVPNAAGVTGGCNS